MMDQSGEPFLLSFLCCLPRPVQSLGHAFPTLCRVHVRLSGRTVARSGLRMMPTFPLSPLSFRTAGFPPYGWKACISDSPFPHDPSLKPAPGISRGTPRFLLPFPPPHVRFRLPPSLPDAPPPLHPP